GFWLGTLLFVLATVGGICAILFWMGYNPFASAAEDPYQVRIPINSRAIEAYSRVTREDMLNPATGGLMFQRVPPEATVGMSLTGISSDATPVDGRIESVRNEKDAVIFIVDGKEVPQSQVNELGGAMMNINAIIGRVVKKDKRAGMAFKEDTFFPQGTPEGIAGATPPGMRAVTLDATKLTGVHALNAGDRIDLMASVPTGEVSAFNSNDNSRLPGAALVAPASKNDPKSGTEPLLLAENAVVLKPVYVRNQASTTSSLTQGKRIQNEPKYEVAIAVEPDDVIPLQSALNRELSITCIAHSMQPKQETASNETQQPTDVLMAPVTVRAILAYEVVTRDSFVNPATRRIRMEPVSPDQLAAQEIATSLDDLLGAVAKHDIPAGSFLRHSDLLQSQSQKQRDARTQDDNASKSSSQHYLTTAHEPSTSATSAPQADEEYSSRATIVGDRPSVTSFIPPGRTAFAIPWNRLYGAEHLQIDDHIDLLASFSLESEDEEEETETRPDGTKVVRKRTDVATRETLRTWDESFGFRSEPWFVATDAIVIGPVGFPAPAAAQRALGTSLNRGVAATGDSGPTGMPLLIAVDDRDVELVAAALATKRALFTPAFHGKDDDIPAPEGMKKVAVAAQDIAAFEAFGETAWQGNRRRPMFRLVPVDDTRFEVALTADEISGYYGRVLKRTKRRDDFFVADDFLPEGTAAGVSAGATEGTTLFAVADREIEGLDSFRADDRVAILVRGVTKPVAGLVTHGFNAKRAVSEVVVPDVRIVQASRKGQTILEIRNEDLTRLQAAWASSFSDTEGGNNTAGADNQRSHLVAVGLPRSTAGAPDDVAGPGESGAPIPAFDPLKNATIVESIVGAKREYHQFAGSRGVPEAKP
ncbi:MAG: hypothetical protein U0936_27310, partial [Planctomycetaceae bacterium]